MIPAGMTGYLQTLDIVINKPFKDHLRMEINDCIEIRMVRNERGNYVKPRLQEIVTWVTNSWNKITDSCVANALRAGYLDKNFAFHETSIARHERAAPKILREIELPESENSGAILETDDLQDIPEDGDMIVLE